MENRLPWSRSGWLTLAAGPRNDRGRIPVIRLWTARYRIFVSRVYVPSPKTRLPTALRGRMRNIWGSPVPPGIALGLAAACKYPGGIGIYLWPL
jgi:hypothetical protein